MEYRVVLFTGEDRWQQADTKVCYEVAAARVSGQMLVRFDFTGECTRERERLRFAVVRSLRRLKRQGRIQVVLLSECFDPAHTEAEYLLNKFPALSSDSELAERLHDFVLVKL